MKHFIGILILSAVLTGLFSCSETTIRKPEKLIPKPTFERMMVDIYLAQGFNAGMNKAKDLVKLKQTDLYYSVLKKYNVPDTVFISSLIYYSSFPKEFEKMHIQMMDYLNQTEQQFRPTDKLKVGKE